MEAMKAFRREARTQVRRALTGPATRPLSSVARVKYVRSAVIGAVIGASIVWATSSSGQRRATD